MSAPLRAILVAALATGVLCDFAPNWTKPQSISAYRNATLADGAHGTLYAVEAAGSVVLASLVVTSAVGVTTRRVWRVPLYVFMCTL
jgi:hypothetical protein